MRGGSLTSPENWALTADTHLAAVFDLDVTKSRRLTSKLNALFVGAVNQRQAEHYWFCNDIDLAALVNYFH